MALHGVTSRRACDGPLDYRRDIAVSGAGVRTVIALLLVALFVLALTAPAQATTRVVHWMPFTDNGSLRPDLIATPKFGGDCWTGSFVLHLGYRCAAGHFLYDPCFSDPTRDDAVVCVGDPFTRHVLRLRVSGNMDNADSARPGAVWAVRLESGHRCTFLAGGASGADSAGRRLNFFCRGSSAVLWGNPIRRGPTWHIRMTRSPEGGPERLVAIRTAYIGQS